MLYILFIFLTNLVRKMILICWAMVKVAKEPGLSTTSSEIIAIKGTRSNEVITRKLIPNKIYKIFFTCVI